MEVPARISYVTIGARAMPALRAFYDRLGWQARPGSNDDFATYEAGGTILALYPLARLGAEAAPGDALPDVAFTGMALGINVDSRRAVDVAYRAALAAGARAVADPVSRPWGGYSGYVADPEGNRWEITWAPGS